MPEKQTSITPQPVDCHVGRRISQLRSERGLSPRELEKKADMAPGAVAALEKGSLSAGPLDLVYLARALKVGPADFFAGLAGAKAADGKNKKPASIAPSEVEAFLDAYFGLSDPQMRKNLFNMVKAMARAESDR